MPLTGTAQNFCDVSIWLDDINGTQRNISGSSNSIGLDLNNNLGEIWAFGTEWPTRLECGKDATINLDVIYSTAANEGKDILLAWFFAIKSGLRTFTFYAPNKNVGSDMFFCEARLESLSFSGAAGGADPVMVSAVLKPDGALSHTDTTT
jgi:hypothetical protein